MRTRPTPSACAASGVRSLETLDVDERTNSLAGARHRGALRGRRASSARRSASAAPSRRHSATRAADGRDLDLALLRRRAGSRRRRWRECPRDQPPSARRARAPASRHGSRRCRRSARCRPTASSRSRGSATARDRRRPGLRRPAAPTLLRPSPPRSRSDTIAQIDQIGRARAEIFVLRRPIVGDLGVQRAAPTRDAPTRPASISAKAGAARSSSSSSASWNSRISAASWVCEAAKRRELVGGLADRLLQTRRAQHPAAQFGSSVPSRPRYAMRSMDPPQGPARPRGRATEASQRSSGKSRSTSATRASTAAWASAPSARKSSSESRGVFAAITLTMLFASIQGPSVDVASEIFDRKFLGELGQLDRGPGMQARLVSQTHRGGCASGAPLGSKLGRRTRSSHLGGQFFGGGANLGEARAA